MPEEDVVYVTEPVSFPDPERGHSMTFVVVDGADHFHLTIFGHKFTLRVNAHGDLVFEKDG